MSEPAPASTEARHAASPSPAGATSDLFRILIVGTSGSGKSTLARSLAGALHCPCIEMDDLRWLPNWTLRDNAEFSELLTAQAAADRWVIDGNVRSPFAALWGRITLVVWLDYPLWLVLARLLWRTTRRLVRREALWSGNRETLRRTFGRDSILLWAVRTHRMNRRVYEDMAANPPDPGVKFLRLRHPRQAADLLRRAGQAGR